MFDVRNTGQDVTKHGVRETALGVGWLRGPCAVMICDLFLLFEVAREKPNQLSVEVPKALSPRWRVVAQVTHDRQGKPRL